jgi:RNA polymerase sigma-70 factor, ECF subfamily
VGRHRSGGFQHLAEVENPEEQLVKALYQEFGGPLLGHVMRLTGHDKQWAEDVVQETLFRAWRNAGKLTREPDLLWAWLLTVARRVVIDGRRKRSARPQEVEPTRLDTVPVPDESERTLSAMVVSEALQLLSKEQREAIVETYFRQRTISEAAKVLGVPEGTVKSRVYYALRALRDALQDGEG